MLLRGHLLFYATAVFLTVCTRVLPSHAQLTNNEVGRPELQPALTSKVMITNTTAYAWTAWGAWSPCSKTCGGGVSVQERLCLSRDPSKSRRSRRRRKMSTSTMRTRRRVRGLHARAESQDCPGLAKRYHECNIEPCPGAPKEPREEQCAAYDRRPFRGRFYTWVPYVDGDQPCILNCRPRGQQFYASLAQVTDGTPCTKPGFRAICVQGACKVVGREGVLASSGSREVRCGRRLVSGLFSRPRLPLGYSYVATVPRGACRLNVSEMMPTDNYIALKLMNGSYIMNGEFAVSAPGTYEAAGARFHYNRVANLDSVFTHGPIQHPIDIMVLYTQPNPSIKYEYLTDTPDESNDIPTNNGPQQDAPHKRHHRHHNTENPMNPIRGFESKPDTTLYKPTSKALETQSQVQSNVIGDRKFTWKILQFTMCSRTCGGGLQIGKFKCVELLENDDKEVSPAHCTGAPPPSRRRRCGIAPCPPRWRAAPWGPCPVCGPAHRTRIVGCVQDHAKGITKISDQKCSLPMPPSSEPCDIPNCDGTAITTEPPRPDARRHILRDRIDAFRDGPVISLTANTSENDVGPAYEPNYSFSTGGGWLHTEWSQCEGWCVGGGIQTRGVRCSDPAGCAPRRAPQATQTCKPRIQCDPLEGQWFSGEWSKCSAPCGGRQVRGALCIGGSGRRLRDNACKGSKPETERNCGGTCSPSWYLSDWGECEGPCEAGIQTRTVWCMRGGIEGATGAARDTECPGTRPLARRNCVPSRCSTKPSVRPSVLNPGPSVSDPQQRVTRHQSRKPENVDIKERSFTDGSQVCEDRLSNCALAVQARLCHYHYYAAYCCRSCHGR